MPDAKINTSCSSFSATFWTGKWIGTHCWPQSIASLLRQIIINCFLKRLNPTEYSSLRRSFSTLKIDLASFFSRDHVTENCDNLKVISTVKSERVFSCEEFNSQIEIFRSRAFCSRDHVTDCCDNFKDQELPENFKTNGHFISEEATSKFKRVIKFYYSTVSDPMFQFAAQADNPLKFKYKLMFPNIFQSKNHGGIKIKFNDFGMLQPLGFLILSDIVMLVFDPGIIQYS